MRAVPDMDVRAAHAYPPDTQKHLTHLWNRSRNLAELDLAGLNHHSLSHRTNSHVSSARRYCLHPLLHVLSPLILANKACLYQIPIEADYDRCGRTVNGIRGGIGADYYALPAARVARPGIAVTTVRHTSGKAARAHADHAQWLNTAKSVST
jgi:hypothetical protein